MKMRGYTVCAEEYQKIVEAEKQCKDKRTSKKLCILLKVPDQMTILHIPPYTPEMNPIEQIWHELRTKGFRNEVFSTLEKVVDRLCETINHLSNDTVMSVTQRDWIKNIFT